MPGITAAPSPVVSSPKSNTASASETNGTADASAGNPFSSVLQRFVKSQDSQGKQASTNDADKAETSTESTTTSGIGATDPALMANLVAMLQSQQTATNKEAGALTGDKKLEDKTQSEEDGLGVPEENPLAGLALNQPAITNETQAQGGNDKAGDNGKQGLTLAEKTAILASSDAVDEKAAGKTSHDGDQGFQALLDNTHSIQLQNQTHTTPIASQVARQENRIETPVGHQNWSQEVGDKLTWMVGKQESKADLVLNPPQMGRIEVSITMNGDQANATFNSNNPAVREALESALPRLKEILADAGVRLDQAQVGTDARGDSPQNQERRDNSGNNSKTGNSEFVPGLTAVASSSGPWLRQGNGMVDTFA